MGTVYALATIGARTERGAHVTLVGDIITYHDGSKAIIDGAGEAGFENGGCLTPQDCRKTA